MNKDFIRKSILNKRINEDCSKRNDFSLKICSKFYEEFKTKKVFLIYMPIKAEVNTMPIIDKLYNENKEIYLPTIIDNNILFRKFNGVNNLVKGKYNILETKGEFLDKTYDVIVIPGIAYDINCYRLGYGKGFYDKFLSSGSSSIRVGLAYDFQIVDSIYPEIHDEPVDIIFTEKRIVRRN